MTPTTALALIPFCILVQGFFSGSEIAIVGSDRLLLRARAQDGDRGAARVLALLEHPTRLVGTCLVGTNLATIVGATLAASVFAPTGRFAELAVVLVYTPLSIVFAELVPKSVYHQYANVLAPVVAVPLGWVGTAIRPVLWAIETATRTLMRAVGVSDAQVNTVRREDIRLLLDNAETPHLRADEREMILRVFHFSETRVRDAMVPLVEMVAVPDTATCEEAAAVMVEQGWSRLPVYRRRVDRVVGMVTHHDLLFAAAPDAPVATVMHPIPFVPESKRVDELFVELRRRRQRLAVAVDEFGGAAGLISIEDILEELVGDIEDEHDRERPLVRRVGERDWVASGRVEAEALAHHTGFDLPDGDYTTLAGFLLERLGHVPVTGERVAAGGYVFVVSLANERAILEVAIQGPDVAVQPTEEA